LELGELDPVSSLALIPIVLDCGEQVEMNRCDAASVAAAIGAWRPDLDGGEDQAATIFAWWEVYRDSRPSLAGGLLALAEMLRG
jgi:hypothetical protein